MSKIALYDVNWYNFETDLPSGDDPEDLISFQRTQSNDLGDTQFTVVLYTAPDVTWYKEIKGFDAEQNPTGWVSTQDNWHGPAAMTLDTNTVSLVFTKAKAFGIHTGMYDVADIEYLLGYVATFTWTKDTYGR